jgi:predicted transcriptional regulator
MNNDVKMTKEDLSKIKNSAQSVVNDIDKLLSFTSKDSIKSSDEEYIINKNPKDKDYEPNNKENEIIKFIVKNPGSSKETVAENMNFSRTTTLKYIEKLLNANIIIYEKDGNNENTYLLYLNTHDSLLALINNLQTFQESYFDLIEKIDLEDFNTIVKECRINIKKFSDHNLVYALFVPFKIIMHIYQFNLLFNHRLHPNKDNPIINSIIFDIFEQISNKLFSSSTIYKIYNQYENDIYFNYFNNIGIIPDTINEMLKIMRTCKLDQEIEKVMDNLWRIYIPFLRYLDPFFSRFTLEELQNWKIIMSDFESSLYSKKREYNLLYNISSA